MIEIEKKYVLNPAQEARLLANAQFLKETINDDTYFDTDDFSLSRNDHWLRLRNGRFEVKRRLHELGHKMGGTMYDEIEDDAGVRAFLHLPTADSLQDNARKVRSALTCVGYKPFAHIVTTRRSYERNGFHIDLDACDFGYTLAEIELMIESPDDREAAMNRIDQFAQDAGLDTSKIRGKIIEYLYRYRPDHYKALQEAGVIRV